MFTLAVRNTNKISKITIFRNNEIISVPHIFYAIVIVLI